MSGPQTTRNEREANSFDLKLYNLIRTAQAHAEGNSAATMKDRKKWAAIAAALGVPRSEVRSMMCEHDRASTA